MKHLLTALMVLGWVGTVSAQQPKVTSVRVFADQDFARFMVDGIVYNRATTFQWTVGSTHVLSAALPNGFGPGSLPQDSDLGPPANCADLTPTDDPTQQVDATCTRRFQFSGWSDSSGIQAVLGTTILVTADPAISYYKASFAQTIRVRLIVYGQLNQQPSGPPSCTASRPPGTLYPGVVSVGGQCYWNSTDIWVAPGAALLLGASPYYGYAFLGFTVNGAPPQNSGSISVLTPLILIAQFTPGKMVRFFSEPTGLNVLIDRTPVPTLAPDADTSAFATSFPVPGLFFWAESSKHILAAPSPQVDRFGNAWMFDSFSNGMGLNSIYTARETNVPESITAKFIRGAYYDIFTNPGGLKLKIDGRDNWPDHYFVWALGSKHQISAPLEIVDVKGRKLRFKGWSNGAAAAQEITVDQDAVDNSKRLIATYEMLGRVTVQSVTVGAPVKVDGVDCTTPCTVDKAVGEKVAISAASITVSSMERLDFVSWWDGGSAERVVTIQGPDPVVVGATFRKAYLLRTASEPDGGAVVRPDQASPDGFYPENSQLTLVAESSPGYRFRRWEGDVSGTYKVAALTMDGPKLVRALMETVPYLAEGGVKNAAGETPDAVVAAGSLISIFGASLAPDLVVGPSNPLAQTIAGVTVRTADRLLPLLFVSPEQINAQLPSDLEDGDYKLQVRWEGHPDIEGKFTLVRNAPGLFTQTADSKTFALALHESGKLITPESPALRGETVSIFGTGFGPYERSAPDGFALPAATKLALADKLELLGGETPIETAWSGAAPGFVGMTVTRFTLPADTPAGTPLELRVRINGRESNKVQLPVE